MLKSYIKRLLFFSLLLFVFSFKTTAANYYWVGGTGNWSDLNHWATISGGTTLHTQIPTALDDVFFDNNSFSTIGQTVIINSLTAFCRNMNWTGVTNNPTLAGPVANLLKIYGSLRFVPGMNMLFAGEVNFESTTAGQTITMSSKTFTNRIRFNGIGGEWTLQDAFTTSNTIYLNNGTFNSADKPVTAGQFQSRSPAARTLNMGVSVFTISGTGYGWWIDDDALMTLNCGSSVINITNGDFDGGNSKTYYDVNFTNATLPYAYLFGQSGINHFHNVVFASKGVVTHPSTFNNLVFQGDGEIESDNVINNLYFTAGHTYTLWSHSPTIGTTQTINGTFHANGSCTALINIHSKTAGSKAAINHPAGTVNVSYVLLKDIHATGGATFNATHSGDLGNNNGWNFSSSGLQNLYWIGNSGNWNDGNHWSFTSGGVASGCSPTPFSNVFFDVNSFSATGQTVLINPLTAFCRNMNWDGVTNNPSFGGNATSFLKIYGSLRFVSGMTVSYSGQVSFESATAGQTITMAGNSFLNKVGFNDAGGEWILQDAFRTTDRITLNAGTLTTNNQTVNAWEFYSTAPPLAPLRTLNMGSSVFNVGGSTACWYVSANGLTLNCGTSVINCTNPLADFRGGDLNYYDLNFTGTGLGAFVYLGNANNFHNVNFAPKGFITHSNTFNKLTFQHDGVIDGNNTITDLVFSPGHSYTLRSQPNITITQTITGTFSATGNCGGLINIRSTTQGVRATISHAPGTIHTSFLVLKDIAATGGGSFTADNSIDLGNNTGWTIMSPNPKNLYWIGNGGDWNDGNHWSLTSGGLASGCSPTPSDNVFFDANSFSTAGQAVTINASAVYCRDMTWLGVTNNPAFTGSSTSLLKIYGSLVFATNMTSTFAGTVDFEATTTGKTINMANKSFLNKSSFNGIGGAWTLSTTFTTTGEIWLNNGTLTTNNQTVNASAFYSVSVLPVTRTLNMGSSVFNLSDNNVCWYASALSTGFTLNCGTSIINSTANNSAILFFGADLTYYDLNFKGTGTGALGVVLNYNRFHDVHFSSKGQINQSNVFHDVTFQGDGVIESSNVFNDLNFTAGHTYTIWKNSTVTVNDQWRIQGSCTSYILLQTNETGFFATITKPSGSVSGYNIHIKDMHCTGGANFIAYNSVNLGGNTGWNFSTLPPLQNPGLISGPTLVCAGATGVGYHISPIQGAISYIWTVPPGATIFNGQGDTLIVVNFGSATSGNITVQSFNGCNPGTSSSSFTVILEPSTLTPIVTLAANPAGPICPGILVTITATASNTGSGNINYNFKVNGTSVQNSSANLFSAATFSNGDDITCNITVSGGVCNTSSSAVSNNIKISMIDCTPVDSSCRLDIKTRIYPNPTGEMFIVNKNPTICKVTMNLYNALGQLVRKNIVINDGLNQIKISALPQGSYFYKFISNNSILLTGKIIRLN